MRVFDAEMSYPGLAMTRSLGDSEMDEYGVTCEPELTQHTLGDDDAVHRVASDGVQSSSTRRWSSTSSRTGSTTSTATRRWPSRRATRSCRRRCSSGRSRRTATRTTSRSSSCGCRAGVSMARRFELKPAQPVGFVLLDVDAVDAIDIRRERARRRVPEPPPRRRRDQCTPPSPPLVWKHPWHPPPSCRTQCGCQHALLLNLEMRAVGAGGRCYSPAVKRSGPRGLTAGAAGRCRRRPRRQSRRRRAPAGRQVERGREALRALAADGDKRVDAVRARLGVVGPRHARQQHLAAHAADASS